MSAFADLTEEERYLLAILQDQSGVDLAEFCWVDETSHDGVFRCWDFQYPWYRSEEKFQIDQCGRAVGKSNGIQMRAFAFPFTNPGEEMLLTAPELIHLEPVTKRVEERIMSRRISREFLHKRGNSYGMTHRPFEARFRNGAKIVGRIPQKDGKGVKGCLCYSDSVILTARGLVAAADLTTDDYVMTHLGNYRRVLHVYRYEAEAVEVAGAGHRGIVVSTNHRFYARRNSNPQRTRNLGPPTWVIADDPEISRWYWGTPTEFPLKVDPPDFPTPSRMEDYTDEKGVARRRRVQTPLEPSGWGLLMALAGRYVADGYTSYTASSKPNYVAYVDDETGIQAIEGVARLLGYEPKRHQHDNAVSVAIYNTDLARWLDQEFGHLAESKTLPAWLLGAPTHLQRRFLDAYLEGDGHWSEPKHRWEISTASKPLAIGIKLLGQALGYSTSFSWVDPKVSHIQGVALKQAPQRSYRVQLNESGHGLVEDGVMWQKIRSVKPVGVREVFDLVVDEDFSYVADGIIHKGSKFLPEDDEVI